MWNDKLKPVINACLLVTFLGILFVINYTQAGMGITGCLINVIGILVITLYMITKNIKYIVLFFLLNTLVGPFFIINFTFIGYSNIGRLDYLVALLILMSRVKKEKSSKVKKYIIILTGCVSLYWVWNIINMKANFDDAYGNILGIGIAYSVYDAIYKIKENNILVGNIFYYIFESHIILSILQLFIPVYLRSSYVDAVLKIGGLDINRPLGLLPNAYSYGISTMFAFFIIYEISSENIKVRLKRQVPVILMLCIISTRAVLFGVLLYIIIIMARNKKMRKIYLLILIVCCCLIINYIISNYKNVIYITDSSNASKLILWGNCIYNFFLNLSFTDLVIGRGFNSSSLLVNNIKSFMSDLGLNVRIDNRMVYSKAFPLHNEYLQILYECGIIIFIYYILNIVKAIKYSLGNKRMSTLLLSIAVMNYCLHNGFFSDTIIFSIIYIFRENEN